MLHSLQSAGDARICKLRNYASLSPYLYAYTVREFGHCLSSFVGRELHEWEGHPWFELNVQDGLMDPVPIWLLKEVTGICTFSSKQEGIKTFYLILLMRRHP